MAAVAKFRKRNIQLRQGARIIKRHVGGPRPAPRRLRHRIPTLGIGPSADWREAEWNSIGFVKAASEAGAIEAAALKFSPRREPAQAADGGADEAISPFSDQHQTFELPCHL